VSSEHSTSEVQSGGSRAVSETRHHRTKGTEVDVDGLLHVVPAEAGASGLLGPT
jgi:hypothetical protein